MVPDGRRPGQAARCSSMDEIRAEIDRMDRQIVPLLAERLGYVIQAAAFKETRADVVVPWRIEDVVQKVLTIGAEVEMDPIPLERMYRAIVDASIAREEVEWDRLHGPDGSTGAEGVQRKA